MFFCQHATQTAAQRPVRRKNQRAVRQLKATTTHVSFTDAELISQLVQGKIQRRGRRGTRLVNLNLRVEESSQGNLHLMHQQGQLIATVPLNRDGRSPRILHRVGSDYQTLIQTILENHGFKPCPESPSPVYVAFEQEQVLEGYALAPIQARELRQYWWEVARSPHSSRLKHRYLIWLENGWKQVCSVCCQDNQILIKTAAGDRVFQQTAQLLLLQLI